MVEGICYWFPFLWKGKGRKKEMFGLMVEDQTRLRKNQV